MSNDKQKRKRKEDVDFKRWVYSLDVEELLDSMAFMFESSPPPSHEYDLLSQMVKLQPPNPNPVHSKAVGYTSRASQRGVRLDYFYKEEERLRWRNPKLFQLTEQSPSMNIEKGSRANIDRRARNHRKHNNNFIRNKNNNATASRRFNVIARRKDTLWGDVYSIGCTQKQENADNTLLLGTFLGRIHDENGINQTTAFFSPSKGLEEDAGEELSASSILNMLRIASRGYFLQNECSNINFETSHHHGLSYCAEWLQPTVRWFSLAMYLSSRFEMALWDAYRRIFPINQQQSINYPCQAIRQGGAWYKYEESFIEMALIRAINASLIDIIKDQQQKSQLIYLRDGALWSLFERNPVPLQRNKTLFFSTSQSIIDVDANGNDDTYWKNLVRSWTRISLIEMHSPHNSRLKFLVSLKLEEELVKQMGRIIFEEEMETANCAVNTVVTKKLTQKKKNRKKKKKRKISSKEILQESNDKSLLPKIAEKIDKDGVQLSTQEDSSSNEDDDNEKLACSILPLEFPKIKTSTKDRNRNIIFVLGILEEITDRVFTEVGLVASPKIQEMKNQDIPINVPTNNNPEIDLSLSEPSKDINPFYNNICHAEPSASLSAIESFRNDNAMSMNRSQSLDQEVTNHHDANTSELYNSAIVNSDIDLDIKKTSNIGDEDNNRLFASRYQSRKGSILVNYFHSQNVYEDEQERLMVASTAASISSSTHKETTLVIEMDELIDTNNTLSESDFIREIDDAQLKFSDNAGKNEHCTGIEQGSKNNPDDETTAHFDEDKDGNVATKGSMILNKRTVVAQEYQSSSPRAPVTPPITLSPIVVSLADLKNPAHDAAAALKRFNSLDVDPSKSLAGPGSLPPDSPVKRNSRNKMVSKNWSREDLRIESFHDDHQDDRRRNELQYDSELEVSNYTTDAAKNPARPLPSLNVGSGSIDQELQRNESFIHMREHGKDLCAQSETAMDSHQAEEQDWYKEEVENQSMTRDETTTVISGISHRVESEELAAVQEERNNFQDLCLTLGAEVAKLKVLLATRQVVAAAPVDFPGSFAHSQMYGSFTDPHGMQPFFHGINNGARPGPMSDAGYLRYGDHESLLSEDEMYDPLSKARDALIDSARRMPSNHTISASSDVSVDFNSIKSPLPRKQMVGVLPPCDSFHFNGLQSRLTKDILEYLDATSSKLRKLDGKRKIAVDRFSRLVKTIWPRAQVKLYGSYISGLCLPSSDLDFVVCLPAVHKKDLALAPGVLEGRNAINTSHQKLLARELKGESWIDPRSIKVIERTVVPVIKVSTKDTRAKIIQLDISFDGPEHHGPESNQMVAQILEELPLIRPLILVLKQFLLHRGLLTAYTGGLSSYCLFLMVARYLQEQPFSSGDCGSLLMGFLDFYGNYFDPRDIGISVRSRQYFNRAHSHNVAVYEPHRQSQQEIWNESHQHKQHVVTNLPNPPTFNSIDFQRRNSFSDAGSVDDSRRRHRLFAKPTSSTHRFAIHNTPSHPKNVGSVDNVRPFTFDPLFVEDPLSSSNNVGRNAFRINQVQRAFSDAHRALVASLDWDIQSAEGAGQYPLLKCLLGGNQREDFFI